MFRPQVALHQANTERIIGTIKCAHNSLYLLYLLYWPDNGRLAAETCSPNYELILKLYHCVDILSCVLDDRYIYIYIYNLLLHNGMASVKNTNE